MYYFGCAKINCETYQCSYERRDEPILLLLLMALPMVQTFSKKVISASYLLHRASSLASNKGLNKISGLIGVSDFVPASPLLLQVTQRPICVSTHKLAKSKNKDEIIPEMAELQAHRETMEKISVFGVDGLMAVMTKWKAQQLANKENLKLTIVNADAKPLPQYKMITGRELHKEKMEKKAEKKNISKTESEKVIQMTSKISDNDIDVKLKKVVQYFEKGATVKIIVRSSAKAKKNMDGVTKDQARLLKHITEHVREVAIVKKSSQTDEGLMILLNPREHTQTS